MNRALLLGALAFCLIFGTAGAGAQTVYSWQEANKHIGENVIVEGRIVVTKNTGKVCYLNFDANYQKYISIVIFTSNSGKFPQPPENYYKNKDVRVSGTITEYQGRAQIVVDSPAQITLGGAPASAPVAKPAVSAASIAAAPQPAVPPVPQTTIAAARPVVTPAQQPAYYTMQNSSGKPTQPTAYAPAQAQYNGSVQQASYNPAAQAAANAPAAIDRNVLFPYNGPELAAAPATQPSNQPAQQNYAAAQQQQAAYYPPAQPSAAQAPSAALGAEYTNAKSVRWDEAHNYQGQTVRTSGKIVRVRDLGFITFLNFTDQYHEFVSLVVNEENYGMFPDAPEKMFMGKTVEAVGEVSTYKGDPQIVLRGPQQIRIIGE